MKKMGILGHFGNGFNLSNGQTIKTKILVEELSTFLKTDVMKVDSHGWKAHPMRLLMNCIKLLHKCNHIIILPAHNGIRIFIPLLILMNLFFRKKIHYVVIGGWLPEFLLGKKALVWFMKKIDSIHVESYKMMEGLSVLGIENTHYMPNFKRLTSVTVEHLDYGHNPPYKLCTFSRVMKEKGIESAIEAVTKINESCGKHMYELDIYGAIDKNYEERFNQIIQNSKTYIYYKGIAPFDQSVTILKSYFLLLFPTYYEGEGFAGTLLDAFASGVPVVASDWRYNKEIVEDGINGYIVGLGTDDLYVKLNEILSNPDLILNQKANCLEEYRKYDPQNIIRKFLEIIGEGEKQAEKSLLKDLNY